MAIRIPTVHLNGSSAESMLDGAIQAARAVSAAVRAVCFNCPNARDYYVKGHDDFRIAQCEHVDRISRLRSVERELVEIYEAIQDQINVRDAQRMARQP